VTAAELVVARSLDVYAATAADIYAPGYVRNLRAAEAAWGEAVRQLLAESSEDSS